VRRPALIQKDLVQIGTITNLAAVFEGISSLEIGKIRDKALSSKEFFSELWNIYSQLRIDKSKLLSTKAAGKRNQMKTLYLAVTSQGGLSGDIDSKVVTRLSREFDPKTTDIMVMGGHGEQLLNQQGIPFVQSFRMPEGNAGFNAEPIVAEVMKYGKTIAYYQTYVSLSIQEVAKIELIDAVKELGEQGEHGEVISEKDYDFEPSLLDIVNYLESVMLDIVLSQVVLESRLSQAASRFNAMAAAKQRAKEMYSDLKLQFNRAKRSAADERTKEVIAVLQKK
jgi:F-type H+-transporting ATPase subunit gamma